MIRLCNHVFFFSGTELTQAFLVGISLFRLMPNSAASPWTTASLFRGKSSAKLLPTSIGIYRSHWCILYYFRSNRLWLHFLTTHFLIFFLLLKLCILLSEFLTIKLIFLNCSIFVLYSLSSFFSVYFLNLDVLSLQYCRLQVMPLYM